MVKLSDLTIDPRIQLQTRGIDASTVGGYVEAIASGAEFPPVRAFSDNGTFWLWDGFHRVEACRFLGLAEIEADIRPGTYEDAMVHAAIANVENGRPMSQAQKEEAGRRLLRLTDWPNAKIARQLAVDPKTVTNWAASMEFSIDRDTTRTVTRGGTTYTMDVGRIGQSKMSNDSLPKPHVSHNAGNNEWYTPKEIIEAAHAVMDKIELDPASTAKANTIIKAQRYYTPEDDGLAQDWRGKTWMNPPYAQPLVEQFASKLIHHVQTGDILEAIILVNNATETAWFIGLISIANAICFPQGRVKFWSPDGRIAAPLQGQAIIYIGDNTDKFLREFEGFGWTARIVSPRN